MLQLPNVPSVDTEATDLNRRLSPRLWRFLSDLMAALRNRTPITGSVTFSAATTAAVSFSVAEPAATYDVWFASGSDNYLWATSKTVNGFTANAKTSNSATFRWMLIRA